jgi:hypothetical protein
MCRDKANCGSVYQIPSATQTAGRGIGGVYRGLDGREKADDVDLAPLAPGSPAGVIRAIRAAQSRYVAITLSRYFRTEPQTVRSAFCFTVSLGCSAFSPEFIC